jgi:hypothetical protein
MLAATCVSGKKSMLSFLVRGFRRFGVASGSSHWRGVASTTEGS